MFISSRTFKSSIPFSRIRNVTWNDLKTFKFEKSISAVKCSASLYFCPCLCLSKVIHFWIAFIFEWWVSPNCTVVKGKFPYYSWTPTVLENVQFPVVPGNPLSDSGSSSSITSALSLVHNKVWAKTIMCLLLGSLNEPQLYKNFTIIQDLLSEKWF